MADIIGGMFGVDPNQLRMERLNNAYQQNMMMAQLDPFQRANAQIANAATGATMLGAQAMGLKTREEQVAENRQQIASMITEDDPKSYIAAAQKAQELGDTQAATMLVQKAGEVAKTKQAMSLQASQEKLNQERLADLSSKQTDLIKTGQLTEDGKKPIYATQSGTQFTLEINPETGEQYKKTYSGGVFVKPVGAGKLPETDLTPDGQRLAAKYAALGLTLPGSGRGNMRAKLLNEMSAGKTDAQLDELVSGVVESKSTGKSLDQLTKINTGIERASKKLEKDIKTIDMVIKDGNWDLPQFASKPLNWARTQTGSASLKAYALSVRQVATEYQKLMQGGAMSVAQLHAGAAEDAKALLNEDMTLAQVKAIIPVMLQEIKNSKEAGAEQAKELTDTLKKKSSHNNAPKKSSTMSAADAILGL